MGSGESMQLESHKVIISQLRHELFAWYKEYTAERLTRLCDLTPSMLGAMASRKLSQDKGCINFRCAGLSVVGT